jgi:hypothetical protein
VEQDLVALGPVVEAEVHRVEQRRARGRSSGTRLATMRRPTASQPLSTEDSHGVTVSRR